MKLIHHPCFVLTETYMAFTLVRFESSGFYLWEHLQSLMYAAVVDDEEALHRRAVNACQTIRNYPGHL
jgi:hypothetical protein